VPNPGLTRDHVATTGERATRDEDGERRDEEDGPGHALLAVCDGLHDFLTPHKADQLSVLHHGNLAVVVGLQD
jgi:hypothetical protein